VDLSADADSEPLDEPFEDGDDDEDADAELLDASRLSLR
jgi:hypothetical protein